MGVAFELVGGLVAKDFHAVSALDKRQPLGDEALQFNRADLRSVLLSLAAALRLLVVVELPFDPFDCTVEEIARRSEQCLEIGFAVLGS